MGFWQNVNSLPLSSHPKYEIGAKGVFMRHKNCIILIIFFFFLSGCAGIAEGSNRMNIVKIGMTKSEVFTTLGLKNYPFGIKRIHNDTMIESWQLRSNWLNNQYHDASGFKISNRGIYRLTFLDGKLVNIDKR